MALPHISINALLESFFSKESPDAEVTSDEIAKAISHIFTNQLSYGQSCSLLTCLHYSGWDRKAEVIAKCAASMRAAAAQVDRAELDAVVKSRGKPEGEYRGGLCDIVGTGGDSHHTFNISTTSSILASSLLLMAKHGNKASTSKSGSADLLNCTSPEPCLPAVTPETISKVYAKSNYAFLYAPVFHPGMKYVAQVRKDLGHRTIFNLLGPLTNPVEGNIEARLLGVARRDIGPVFAEALRMNGTKRALVVCGEEDLDEISCAGKTYCWTVVEKPTAKDASINGNEVVVVSFILTAADFGLPSHPLADVSPGKEPHENAAILTKLLQNQLPRDDPIYHFVLMNTAALFVVSGVCEAETSHMGHGDDGKVVVERGPGGGRWKEGVRRARWAVESGEAWRQYCAFAEVSNSFAKP